MIQGNNSNENDLIENLTFRNICHPIRVFGNGLNAIQNNKFENCEGDLVTIYDGSIIVNNCSFELLNNIFINNDCMSCFSSELVSQNPALVSCEIKNNIFESNTTLYYPLLFINGHGQLDICNNSFIENSFSEHNPLLQIVSLPEQTMSNIQRNIFKGNSDSSSSGWSGTSILSIEESGWADYTISDNSFVENSANKIINFEANNTCMYNTIFLANNLTGSNEYVIYGENIYCDHSLFWNNTNDYYDCYNGNCIFGDNILEVDPLLDVSFRPIWDSTTKSLCIDAGYGSPDSDGTPADIGAITAITHKYDTINLPSPETDGGLRWLSFPALDNVYSVGEPPYDPDVAGYLLYDIMQEPIPAILNKVYAQDYEIWYYNEVWQHKNEQFSRTEGFKFLMNEETTLEVSGFKVLDNTTITLEGNNVENWVGYWLEETQDVEEAFGNLWDGDNLTMVKAQHWTAVKFEGNWKFKIKEGHSPTISYGEMVIVNCNTTINNFKWDNSTPEDPKVVFGESKYFTYEEQADYVPIYVEIDPTDPPVEIGAMVDGVYIGATVVEDTLIQINAYVSGVLAGDIELELYYGECAEPRMLSSYKCISVTEPNRIETSISTSYMQSAYFITLWEDSDLIPDVYRLSIVNYPNPFNPSTTISYSIPNDGKVDITFYNIKGQKVKTLINGEQQAGAYKMVWNGDDSSGKNVSSGIYFYKLSVGNKMIIKKMILLK